MANKEEIKKVEGAEEEAKKNTEEEKKDEEAKKKEEEAKKEFALIRWAKAIGQGVANTAKAVNGFVHNHPYITAGITTAAGYGAKMAVDYFTGSTDSEVETHESSEVLSLPEPEDEYALDMPEDMEEEVTEDNANTNVD